MKLYATITKTNGKSEGLGDNNDLVVNFYYKNKVVYMVRMSYENVGDIEAPAMDLIITHRDYRSEANKIDDKNVKVKTERTHTQGKDWHD